jgi:hypothetical protein
MTSIPAASRDGLRWAKPSFVRAIIPLALALLISACKKDDAKITGPSCPVDQMACGPICLDVTADPMNCGGCGIPCSTGQICQGGACQCVSGLVCNGACVPSDATHCGDCATSCPSGQVCSSNICSSACSVGQTPCGTACTDTNGDDVFNCGGCGMPCAPGKICSGGICLDVSATGATGSDGGIDVTVNDSSTAQTWEGFGGAFNEMGWHYLSMLSPSERDHAIHLLYGAEGARFAFGRIPIGSSDYAMERYTLDETAGDVSLAGFSIDHDTQLLIPFVQAAQAVKTNIRFWASPWTPPTWMKDGPFSSGKACRRSTAAP